MPTEAPTAAAEVLLLEQNADEVALIRQSAEKSNVTVVVECEDILSYLRREGEYENAPRPDLVILDLDLSRTEDCETLTEIKKHPSFKRIPVVVLASAKSYDVVLQAYDLRANAYINKPAGREEFMRIMRATLHFWLTLVRLPRD
jgi:DNA-binding NarL/FixJ family response regulator